MYTLCLYSVNHLNRGKKNNQLMNDTCTKKFKYKQNTKTKRCRAMFPQLIKRCVLCWVSVVSETLRLVALLQIVRHRAAMGIPYYVFIIPSNL